MTDASTDSSITPAPRAEIGVIGGSGFYSWLDDATPVAVDTPFGEPSETPVVGQVGGRTVAFIPRHGRDHRFAPHRVNYRANLWALRHLGVRQVIGPCAVGSLRADLGPGTLVVPDQVIDRTWGRAHTIYDADGTLEPDGSRGWGSSLAHVAFADPYCARGRRVILSAAAETDWAPVDGGTLVVVNGPRFSSRAESRWHAAAGGDLVGMTGMPEASIARELALCYTSMAVVTDLDAGVEHGDGVTHAEVMATFARSVTRLQAVLSRAVAALDDDRTCPCRRALDGLPVPFTVD
ncbi:MAG: S-methyl-5'-thioadenosine phosphorylase [Kineosporiaceae bacterium]|nr:S-methyl-5'-thioadenosine phosphorylase [Kineosporiaceae bacterium]